MLRIFKYIVFVLFFIGSGQAYAQYTPRAGQNDTTRTAQQLDSGKTITPLKVDYILDPLNNSHFQSIDTSLNGWELNNSIFAEGLGRTYLSDANTASRNLIFTNRDFISPVIFTDPFYFYQFNPDSLRFYHGTRRYTQLDYIQGQEKDQQVKINYEQLLSKRLFAGFDYRRAASIGYFNQQITGVSNLDLWLSYYSRNFRYRIFADAIWNSNSSQENGGLKLNYYSPDQQPLTLPVNLNQSENRTRTRYVNVMQFWSPSFLSPSSSDTTGQSHYNSYTKILPTRFFLSSSFQRNTYTYSDQAIGLDSSFYQHFYINANSTQDSTVSDQFSNKLGIQGNIGSVKDSSSHPSRFEASVNYDFFSLRQGDETFIFPSVLHEFADLSASASLRNDSSKLFWLLGSTYYFDGRNKNDYSADGRLGYHLNKVLSADVHGGADLTRPSLLEDEYYSNNFIWQNDFEKKEIKKVGATISSVKYKFSVTADYFLMNNFIYFDSTALPAQVDQQKLMSIQLNDRIRWRHWNLLTKIVHQQAGSNDVLRLPEWQTYNSLYYENHFFRSALFAQIGLDVRYLSGYYGDAYMPATRVFYLQDAQKVGGYETVDAFVNMRIKAARVFLKFENIESFFNSSVHYYVPGYPVTPFAIRFGISMRFFDL